MTVIWSGDGHQRVDPERLSDEKTALEEWVDFHRATLLMKCEGLTAEQLKKGSVEPLTLLLLGLVRPMSEVERSWFRRHAAQEDVEFRYESDEDLDVDLNDLETADAAEDIA